WRSRCQPRLVLDFHAPVTCHTLGIFAYLRDLPDGRPDAAHAPWIEAIEQALNPLHRAVPFAHSGRYPSRWNTARLGDFVNHALRLPQVTIETPYAHCRETLLVREDYQTAGRQIADAIMGVIASSPEVAQAQTDASRSRRTTPTNTSPGRLPIPSPSPPGMAGP